MPLAGLALLAIAAPSVAQSIDESKAARQLRALTPEAVEQKVSIADDDLELFATLTTRDAFREKRGLFGKVPFDTFLRAFIDKKSGRVRYQVYATFLYTDFVWARWILANYETGEGPKETKLTSVARVRGSCNRYTGCARLETIVFPVDERVLRTAATSYRPGASAVWRFKLKAKTGADHVDGLASAEIAGLLRAVDSYKAAKGLNSLPRR